MARGPKVRFDKLLDYWTPQMRRAFYQAIRNVTSSAQIEQLAIAIQNRDMELALKAINLNPVNFRPIDQALWASFEAGGNATAATFPLLGEAGSLRTVFQFNVRNPAAEQWISDYSSTMVTELVDGQVELIRQYLTRAMEQGINPRTAALDLVGRIGPSGYREGGLIGLTSSQEKWVRDYTEALAGDNPLDALTYNLRDGRYDALIRRIVEDGDVLSADQIENMVGSYTNRALRYRAETIARTEMLTSLGEAQQQAMDQAVEQGLIEKDNVTYIWRTARDDRVRDSHALLEGEEQKMGDVFSNGLLYPGDPAGPAEEVINCRCWLEPKVDFFAGVK